MNNSEFFYFLKRNVSVAIIFGLLIASFSFFFLSIYSKNYKVSADFLVVQNQSGNQDFYSLSRSAEYWGNILSEAIYSEIFINEVVATGKVNPEFLPFDKKKKLKAWREMIKVSRDSNLGIIKVEILENDSHQALAIAEAMREVLISKNYLFRGKADLDVRLLSGPITEKNPGIKEIALGMVGGFLLGAILAIVWTFYFKENSLNTEEKNYIESLKDLN